MLGLLYNLLHYLHNVNNNDTNQHVEIDNPQSGENQLIGDSPIDKASSFWEDVWNNLCYSR